MIAGFVWLKLQKINTNQNKFFCYVFGYQFFAVFYVRILQMKRKRR